MHLKFVEPVNELVDNNVLFLIKQNNKISASEINVLLKISLSTISGSIKELKTSRK